MATGTLLTLTATADQPGWRFSGWTGGCSGLGTCQFPLDGDLTVTVAFHAADTTAPTVTAPTVQLPVGQQLSAGFPAEVPIQVTWTATDPDDGLSASDLQAAVNGGTFTAVSLPSPAATSIQLLTSVDTNYRLRARGTDQHGNVGDWVEGPPFTRARQLGQPPSLTVLAQQETAADRTGTWTTHDTPDAWGGSTITTQQPQASATFTVQGEQVAIIGTTGPGHGAIGVYLDGQPVGTIGTASPQETPRRILTRLVVAGYRHTIRVVTTSTDPVELDGVVVLQ